MQSGSLRSCFAKWRPRIRIRRVAVLALFICMLMPVSAQHVVRVGLDSPEIGLLDVLVAIEKVQQLGYEVRVHYMHTEGLLAQSVADGLIDIGMGTPYDRIQQDGMPIRMFFQLQQLRFYPVVNTRIYRNWKDLDGATIYVHGPGSGTEAIMKTMAMRHGIRYSGIKYMPGSATRMKAMLNDIVTASILDDERRNKLLAEGGDRFAVLPIPMYLMFSSGVVFWLAYGLAIGDLAVSLANGVTLLFALPILVVKLINRVKGIE